MQSRSIFERHPRITLVLLVSAAILAADLLAARFFIPVDYGYFRIPHPFYHHGLLPSEDAVTRWKEGEEYPFFTNSLGFRDGRVRDVPLRSDARRILFIGDSTAEGLGVTYEQSFVGWIQKRLEESNVEVLNAAAISYSPKLYYLKVRFLIEKIGLEFDELVVFIDTSDIQDELYYRLLDPSEEFSIRYAWNGLHKWLARTSFFYYFIAQRSEGASKETGIDFGWDDEVDLAPARKYPNFALNRPFWTVREEVLESWGREGLELARANMAKLVDLCEKHGIEVTIVVYPHPVQMIERDLDSIQVQFWRDFAGERSISFVDLFPDFIHAQDPAEVYRRLFLRRDAHWNPAGHAYVGRRVLSHIRGKQR